MEWEGVWDATPVVGVLVRAKGSDFVVSRLNQMARRMAGVAADTFVGMSLTALFPDAEEVPALVRRARETGEVQSVYFPYRRRTTGGETPSEFRSVPVTDDTIAIFVTLDPPDHLRPKVPSVDDLQDEAAAAWLTEGQASVFVWRIEPDGDFTLVEHNERAVELTKGGVLQLRGLRARSLYFDQPQLLRFLERVRDEGRAEDDALPLRMVTQAQKGKRYFRSLGLRREGYLFCFVSDRTEEHVLAGQLATAEKRLRRAERLDSLGRLAGGIAHDFNNLLAAIVGLGELIRREVDGPVREDVDALLATADRGAALTRQLLAFAGREESSPRPFAAETLLTDLRPMLDRAVGSTIEIQLDTETELPAVLMDPTQLEQIVVNLVVNAREAMPEGGRLSVRLRRATDDDRASFGEVSGEGFLLLEIEDEGVGIATELQEAIFEPFVTSKEEGSGGGLGLATVMSLLNGAGGKLRLTSALGAGSTFHMLLPTTDEPPERKRPSSLPPPRLTADGARVLLVEDDPLLRRVLERSLSRDGFQVTTARDGREALELLDQGADLPFDILVTDVVMPNVSGPELALALRERWPELPVVFCSGHHTEELVDGFPPPVAMLTKPTSHKALVQTMQRVLGQSNEQ